MIAESQTEESKVLKFSALGGLLNDGYAQFLKSKRRITSFQGIEPQEPHAMLYPFQRDIVKWALRLGRACIFADCGLGKTFMQIEWAKQIPGDVLILSPLSVAQQTIAEAAKLGVKVNYVRSADEVQPGISIANYEMLEHFDCERFTGVVLDESSCIKHFDSATRTLILRLFAGTKYRLACTATPAPNDHAELGNHSEFMGAMSRVEMLATFFVHEGETSSAWRLKGHAESKFWEWICTWAVMLRKPSDLGYDDKGFDLPPLEMEEVIVEHTKASDALFPMPASTLKERIVARRDSVEDRVKRCAGIINLTDEPWIVWCNLNSEADALEAAIPGALQVKGSQSIEVKTERMRAFSDGSLRVLVTKPSIAGFGMNWQHCHNVAFVGLSDSWEEYYQAVRRCWRFGQLKPVNVIVIISSTEGAVLKNIQRKERDADIMASGILKHTRIANMTNLHTPVLTHNLHYSTAVAEGQNYRLHLGDCVEVAKAIKEESIDYSIFSPPFASLYTYSASERDMGNCEGADQFCEHFKFLVARLYKLLKPGRLVSFHCMNLPTSKVRNGYIGLTDFRGQLIRCFQESGFIFHSEVCIWKDPVTAMQRTKALGLLHKQLVKDSCMSRQGVPDYLVTMRKPGENKHPVQGELDRWVGDNTFQSSGRLSIDIWQRYASPVWMDIRQGRTLQKESAREEKDEKHICPLQLDVIERAMELWTNPGDTVLSPFAGIGSELYIAIKTGRKAVGIELKKSYWEQAAANLQAAESEMNDGLLPLI